MKNKTELTNKIISKLKKIAKNSIENNQMECALASIAFAGQYLYDFNQYYSDDDLENYLLKISNKLCIEWKYEPYKKTSEYILLYDGFGLDTRGVVNMYLNALGLNNYKTVYVTSIKKKEMIPTITNICKKYDFEMRYIDTNNFLSRIRDLKNVFDTFTPKSAFFYTTPNDVSGAVSFNMFEGAVDRFLIDLTDHAFWIGKKSCDYFLGSRDMSAYIEHFERKIPKEKMIKLGVNLLVDDYEEHPNLPFDVQSNRYVFSGGSLYKTLGDKNNSYYKIVNHILKKHNDIFFLYCGNGDKSEINKIVCTYPGRAYCVDERKDFYYLIQNSVFYLNTFPMFGGMMMKYSALAGKLPLTLKHGNDSDGLLINQNECEIEYNSLEEMLVDIDKLLEDKNYLHIREQKLINSVISEERFKNNLRGVIEKHTTDYQHSFIKLNTKEFRKEYYNRFNYNEEMLKMVSRKYRTLIRYFPVTFIKGLVTKIYRKIMKENNL